MTLNPEIARILTAIPPAANLDVAGLPIDEALSRLRNRVVPAIVVAEPVPVADLSVPSPDGDIPIRCYGLTSESAPRGVIVNLHGGGWVMGSIAQDDYLCQLLARATSCAVVSAEYRLAPEAPFPGPLNDCYRVASWAAAEARALTNRDDRLAVCGSSAGANLAMGVAALAATEGHFGITAQLLLYPVCDAAMDTPSYRENARGYHLTSEVMAWFWDRYVPDGTDRTDPLLSPARTTDFSRTPRTVVIAAEYDPLRDEAERYAAHAAAAGVPTRYVLMPGLIHGFFRLVPDAPWVRQAIGLMAATIDEAFAET